MRPPIAYPGPNGHKRGSVNSVSLSSIILVPIALAATWHWLLGDLVQSLTLGFGALAVTLGLSTAARPIDRISPVRVFLPILAVYCILSIRIAGTNSSSLQLLCTALAVAGFMLGYFFASGKSIGRPWAGRDLAPRNDLMALCFILGTATFAYLVARAGRPPAMAADTNLARTQFFPDGITSTLVIMNLEAVLIVPIAARILRTPKFSRSAEFMAVLAFVELALLGNRGLLVAPCLVLVITFLAARRPPLGRLAIIAVAGFALFSYAGYERNYEAYGESYVSDLRSAGYEGKSQFIAPTLDYIAGTSETFDRSLVVVNREGFQDGLQFFSPLLLAESADLWLKESLGLTFVGFGLAIGFVNAFYIDWGVPGALVGPLMVGVAVGLVRLRALSGDPRWMLIYCYVAARLLLSVYGHPFAYAYYAGLPILLFMILGRPKARSL